MLTAQLMAVMPDDHLIAAIHAERDPLTSTAIEDELLNRFEASLDPEKTFEDYDVTTEQIEAILEAHPASGVEVAAMLAALAEAGIDDAEALVKLIERANTELV